ncbi:MAG: hypothetical protein ICV84_15770 [Flavisolibacter sp.]|nr:hypothetical protein [Flavisolibacter sp.]
MAQKDDQTKRNRPADEGRRNDPHVREESAQQPGVNTYSSSDTDNTNEHVTKTASDNFDTSEFGKNADPTFDEVDREEDGEVL